MNLTQLAHLGEFIGGAALVTSVYLAAQVRFIFTEAGLKAPAEVA